MLTCQRDFPDSCQFNPVKAKKSEKNAKKCEKMRKIAKKSEKINFNFASLCFASKRKLLK
jgi:hypothetical protein